MTVPSVANWVERLERVAGITSGPTGAWAYDWFCVNNFLKYGGTCLVGGTGSEVFTSVSSSGTPLHQKKHNLNITFASTGANSMAAAFSIADTRKDCLAVIGTTLSAQVNSSISATTFSSTSSDYSVNVYGHKRMIDERDVTLNNVISITVAPDVAGCFARTFRDYDAWTTPAGTRRGRILGVINMVDAIDLSTSAATSIDTAKGNVVTTLPGQGTFLMGNNTGFATASSSLAKINSMLVVLNVKKKLTTLANDVLFEINNASTRALFKNAAEPVLRDIQTAGGLYQYKIVCDETNNGAAVLDQNRFVVDVFLKISKTAETIQLSIIPVNSSVSLA
jgi:phage tail sheath protein FI